MNKYIIEISAPKLVGKVIRVGTPCRDRSWYGVITDVLYALVIPTDEQMATVYGEDWKEKPCKSAQKAIDYDRVKFIDKFTGEPMVVPLNPHSSYMVWELDLNEVE